MMNPRLRFVCAPLLYSVIGLAGCGDDQPADQPGDASKQDANGDAASSYDASSDGALAEDSARDAQQNQDGQVDPDTGVSDTNPLAGIGDVELVEDGFSFTEGPVWDSASNTLLFSDMVFNNPSQGRTLRLTPPSTIEPFRTNTQNGNGMAFMPDGTLLICEQNGRKITQRTTNGSESTFVDKWLDNDLNSPNDLAVTTAGDVYFTDPPYGLPSPGDREIEFNGVFFKAHDDANVRAEWEGDSNDEYPNGIALSPSERYLYVADNRADLVRVHRILPDGGLEEPTDFAEVEAPDGMTVDRRGNVYVTTDGGIDVFAADGSSWGKINVPKRPSNCAFGGTDGHTLYITARDSLYAVVLAAP